ncbi:MAG: hypothetical protein Q9195_007894 [Heterodermia aff. obscurata]
MAQSYKSMKEDFVSNLSGGSIGEINQVTAVAPAAYLLWSALQTRRGFFANESLATSLTDFLLHVVCLLLATTLYSSAPLVLDLLLLAPGIALLILPQTRKKISKPAQKDAKLPAAKDPLPTLPTRPFVTVWRGGMMIITCLAILAVDFKVFPRRFAKVENWGTSLMDVGVGSFVFSAGVVSARPMLRATDNKAPGIFAKLATAIKHALPLLALGLLRLYSVKGLDYAEHVTEYGVHWNFFFTIGLLPPFVTLFQTISATSPTIVALISFLLASAYESLLEFTDLKAFILTAPRVDFLSQNREGIFSFSGYLAIFLAGQSLGLHILGRQSTKGSTPSEAFAQRIRLLVILMMWSLLWGVLFIFTTSYGYGFNLKVSRRLANLPYVLWVATFNCAQLTLFCFIETCCFPALSRAETGSVERKESARATPRVLRAFNRNGLAIFLVANLLTGMINLGVDTLRMTQYQAMGILLTYAALVTSFAMGLDHWDISIKL